MLTRMTLFLCPIAMAIASYSHASDYTFTRDRARKLVLDYCHTDCHGLFLKPPVPCCGVFEQAMRGDPSALHRVFTERNLQSGDNESWSFTAWPLLHVVGDGRFAAFLRTLTTAEQSDVFEQIFYEGSYYPEAIASGYFERKFPRVAAFYRKLYPRKVSNNALQPTPSRLVSFRSHD
jgi:hypothetical protein